VDALVREKLEQGAELCRRHSVLRLSLFGSAVRQDFDAARSDLDFLVDFEPLSPARDARLAVRPDPSDSAWASLAVARDQFAARLTRMVERKRINKDGAIELMRWRHPGPRARRVRPMRFVRP
jgi:Nucleotidyltransferase domain